MKNYIVRVYRARLYDGGSVVGYVEDTESGQKEPFHSLIELQTLLAHSILRGQLELPYLTTRETISEENLAGVA